MADYPFESLWIISDVDTMTERCVNHAIVFVPRCYVIVFINTMFSVLATSHHFLALFTKFSRIWSSYSLT